MPGEAIGLVVVHVAVLVVPGVLVALAAGLRLRTALLAAPLVTFGLATAAGTLAGSVDVPWGPGLLAAEAVGVAAVLALARVRSTRPARTPLRERLHRPRGDLVVAAGVLAGAALSVTVLARAFGGIGRANQAWDYTFHANATRLIADTGDVAPSALRVINNWEEVDFYYPNALHALAAVVRDLTGSSVFAVLNTQTLLIGPLTGLGLALLLRELGAPTAVSATTPVLLAGFAAFPYDVLWRGPLLPYAWGLALTPAFLLVVRELVRAPRPGVAVLTGLCAAGLLGLHPSVAVSGAGLAVLLLAQTRLSGRRVGVPALLALALAGLLAAVLAAPGVVGALRTNAGVATAMDWRADETTGQAVGDLLLLNHASPTPQLALAALVLAGLLSVRSARYMAWWLAGAGCAFVLFVLAASSDGQVAQVLTRPWWNDRYRFAALAVLGMAPLAAHGLWRVAGTLADRAPALLRQARTPRWAVAVLLLVAVVAVSGGLYAGSNTSRTAAAYQSDLFLNDDEVRAMAWLAPQVAAGETVMNDPSDGSAYLEALQAVRPLFGHQVPNKAYSTVGPTQRALLERFRCLDSDDDIRRAVERLDVGWVFLGTGFVEGGRQRAEGLSGLGTSPSLSLVYAADGVRIYRVALGPPLRPALEGCTGSALTAPTD